MTFKEGLEIWRRHKQLRWSPIHAVNVQRTCARLGVWFKSVELSKLGVADFERYECDRAQLVGAPSLNRERSVLQSFFKYARVHGWIARDFDPLATWAKRREHVRDEYLQTITPEEEARLRSVWPEGWPFVVVALYSGLRRGVVAALDWGWISVDWVVIVPPQFQKSRRKFRVPLGSKVVEALAPLRPSPEPARGPVFDPHISPGAWTMRLRRAIKKAGINPKLKLHDLRHTFGTRLANKGVPITKILRLGDWSTSSVFYRHYLAKLGDDDARDALEKV